MTQLEFALTYPVLPLIVMHWQSERGMSLFSPTAETRAFMEYATQPKAKVMR